MGMGVITMLTVLDEGFDRLRYGFDTYGNICGRKNPVRPIQRNFQAQDTTDFP